MSGHWPMEAAYTVAGRLLQEGLTTLGRPIPERIPLRLRGEDGLLLSAVARAAGAESKLLAQALAKTIVTADTPFVQAEARDGLLLLPFSRDWLDGVLDFYASLPWPELEEPGGYHRQDRGDAAFLREYTLRRCRELSGREESGRPMAVPPGLVCLLAEGPGTQPEIRATEIARRYWKLPAAARRSPRLAGAVGRAAGGWYFLQVDSQKVHLRVPKCGIITENVKD